MKNMTTTKAPVEAKQELVLIIGPTMPLRAKNRTDMSNEKSPSTNTVD